jgi:lysosomal acid lipase/cholesteryl ester hydrolase
MIVKIKVILFLANFFILTVKSQQIQDDEVVNFIKQEGYRGEVFQVTTEDGYILRVHHMFPKIFSGNKKPVFLLHSAFSNPIYFLNSGKNISLGFLLSDNGYDVWFGNVRGSKYATAHKWLPVDGKDYWRFDFHEMGIFDLPPMIDLALQRTGAQQVFYIGHSQACPSLLALLSLRPQYNSKIAQSHLLAPVANMMHIRPSLKPWLPVFLVG